ncbi:MAG: ATP-binding cassette domain-containing protein, partial [Phycisphaerales bacterium]|nr:ATP-binding cassette domain-containing protein [Phycisphaerales bacterium]
TEQRMRDLLGRFGVVGDQVYQLVGAMSGGERSRVALARLVALGVNVLVLDEPTNHLDLWACDALEKGLQEFEGTVIVVSHDRWFLNRVVDLLIVLDGNGGARLIHGNYDTYERMRQLQEPGTAKVAEPPPPEKNRPAPAAPAKRKRRFPYRKAADIEADIAANETHLHELEQLMASPDLYRDGEKVKQTTQEFEEVKVRIAQLYEHWEEAMELN